MSFKRTRPLAMVVGRRNKGDRKERLTLKMRRTHTSDPRYMCNLQEYMIRLEEGRGYYIHQWAGRTKPRELQGHWPSFRDCEKHLCLWIMKNDRTGLSIYPNGPPLRKTYYTEAYLKNVTS